MAGSGPLAPHRGPPPVRAAGLFCDRSPSLVTTWPPCATRRLSAAPDPARRRARAPRAPPPLSASSRGASILPAYLPAGDGCSNHAAARNGLPRPSVFAGDSEKRLTRRETAGRHCQNCGTEGRRFESCQAHQKTSVNPAPEERLLLAPRYFTVLAHCIGASGRRPASRHSAQSTHDSPRSTHDGSGRV